MNECFNHIAKPKRYVQFNDLVFTGRKSIDTQSESTSFRISKVERTFTHGSYVANRGNESIIDTNTISLQIALETSKWSEDEVQGHYDFIIQQLTHPGKLWAVAPGLSLVWCNAYVTSIQHASQWVVTDDGYLVFQVEFDNPDGYWYKAEESKVFLDPFDLCDFTAMKAECIPKSRYCCNEPILCFNECECCESTCDDMCDMIDFCSVLANREFINDFFEECNSKWRIVYNCEKALIDGKEPQDLYRHAVCQVCITDQFSGQFFSDTVLTSKKWSIALMGHFKDPIISINYKDIQIKGEYDGIITLDYTGQARFAKSWECISYGYETIPLDNIDLCAGMFEIKKGQNEVNVTNVLSDYACIYINYERITI